MEYLQKTVVVFASTDGDNLQQTAECVWHTHHNSNQVAQNKALGPSSTKIVK